jgi:naphthoate synthase
MALEDVRYEVEQGLAWITIDRPERLNAFRARTVDELVACFTRAWADATVGVVCLTGAGVRAFCAGGDQKQRAETGDYGPSESGLFEVVSLHFVRRRFGTGLLARAVGEKRAREIWYLCRQYDAAAAERWGLVNAVVPAAELRDTVRVWADEMLAMSPTALRFLTQSFNADSEHLMGTGQVAFSGLHVFGDSAEAREGVTAFAEKRRPSFDRSRAGVSV